MGRKTGVIRKKGKKTEDELKQLAHDIHKGLVFTDLHCKDPDLLPIIFMPLSLMDKKSADAFMKGKPVLLYEYMKESTGRSINGYPVFGSVRYLLMDEFEILRGFLVKIEKAMSEI